MTEMKKIIIIDGGPRRNMNTARMLQVGNFMSLLAYVTISVIAGIALVAAGYYLVRI